MAGLTLKLIYISGYGRSGTTALSGYLSRYKGSISLGEIFFAFDKEVSREICSCGSNRRDCDIWGNEELVFDIKNYIATLGLLRVSGGFEECVTKLCFLLSANTIIDSSKNAWKKCLVPIMLGGRHDTVVVHIKRNLWDVLRSVSKGRNRYLQSSSVDPRPKYVSLFITFFGWMLSNLTGYIASKIYENVYWVRYENIFLPSGVCEEELQAITEKMNPIENSENRHEVSGNRTAMS